MMKQIFAAISTLTLFAALSFGVVAQDPVTKGAKKAGDATKKAAEKTADETKEAAKKTKEAVTQKSDADIGKCITDGLAASAKLKDQGFTATVNNGEATLSGTAKSSGDAKDAEKIAKNCGAKKVINNITVPAKPAKEEKKPDSDKKSDKKSD
jgi:osmotically-inducible protein OsmY